MGVLIEGGMKTQARIGLMGGLLAWAVFPASAGDWQGNLQAGAGYWAGETRYSIGGTAWTPADGSVDLPGKVSELKFPFDVTFGAVGGSLFYQGQVELHGRVMANITEPSSKMKDSDWGVFSEDPGALDVYSESDAQLSAFSADVGVRYWLLITPTANPVTWSLGVGPSLLYQRCDWTISNVDEWSPSDPGITHQYESGKVATYSATTVMPYLDCSAMMTFKALRLRLGAGLGPVLVHDEDDHLLRQKRSTADMTGVGAITSVEATVDITSHVFIQAKLAGFQVNAFGTQSQKGYGGKLDGYYAEIDETYNSTTFTGDISIGCTF